MEQAPGAATIQAARQRRTAIHLRRATFSFALVTMLSVVVLLGFARTFYLRAIFNVPKVRSFVLIHGAVLTAWFAGLVIQVAFVAAGRTRTHRRWGWMLVALGGAVAVITAPVILSLGPSQRAATGHVTAGTVSLVWLDLGILLTFVTLLVAAVRMRRKTDWHKRLMLLASIGLVAPALGRVWRLVPSLAAIPPTTLTAAALLLMIVAVVCDDLVMRKRIHPATLVGGSLILGVRWLASAIGTSAAGTAFVNQLR